MTVLEALGMLVGLGILSLPVIIVACLAKQWWDEKQAHREYRRAVEINRIIDQRKKRDES